MAFDIVRFFHIAAAIVAVGTNITYAVWLVRAGNNPGNTAFALNGIKFLDHRIANPAYGVLLVTGILMVVLMPYPIITFWIDAALIIYLGIAVIGATQYSPLLKGQIRLAEGGDVTSETYMRLARRGRIIGQLLALLVVVILFLMVFRPNP